MTTHEARLVGGETDLGDVSKGVEFYGALIFRDWTPADFRAGGLAKAQGNPCIEVREATAAQAEVKPLTKDEAILRLIDLGVEHDPKAKVGDLRDLLAKAEAAKAAADAEAEDDDE